MSDARTIPGPEPDPNARPHGDFDLDDLITPEDDPGDPDAEPVNLFSDEEREKFTIKYPGSDQRVG